MYSLRLCTVLKVAHSTDGFGLLAGITVAFMEHLGVTFLSAPVLGVLEAFKSRKNKGNNDYVLIHNELFSLRLLPPAQGLEHGDQLFRAHS